MGLACLAVWFNATAAGRADEEAVTHDELRVSTHLEFLSQWFPPSANSAVYVENDRATRLATQLSGELARFESTAKVLDLIRNHVGFDPCQIDRFTTATIATGTSGSVVFFTTTDPIPLESHFASGIFPLTPERHRFQDVDVYYLGGETHRFGLYTSDGHHFILGDWEVFKRVLSQQSRESSSLTRLLATHTAPIIICSNPRKNDRHSLKNDPFGKIISLDFQEDTLAFLIQEEHPTPAAAIKRLDVMEKGMPGAMKTAYGLSAANGAASRANSDGRHVTFATRAPVSSSKKLLQHLLGKTVAANPHRDAATYANLVVDLFQAATESKSSPKSFDTPSNIVAALSVGIDGRGGERYELPFLTGIEQEMVSRLLSYEDGELTVAQEIAIAAAGPTLDEREIRRHAKLLATVTMSAAAAGAPQLETVEDVEALVDQLCTTGIHGGPGYHGETFRGPDLSPSARSRVASYLKRQHGYLVYDARH